MDHPICIYHGNCQDGFGAAWAVRHALGDIEFHAGVYQNDPPDVAGRVVLIVDFSYKRPVLEAMAEKAKSILILDHHKTAQEDLKDFPIASPQWIPGKPISALFDMERSGAGIAWDFFHPGKERPLLINSIEDRDLWRFRIPKTREITAALFSYPYDFSHWDHLMRDGMLGKLAVEGEAIERKHHKDVTELVKVSRREMVIGGLLMPVANLPYTLTSDAGHLMATEHASKAAACYMDLPEGRTFSLRSLDDGPDVSAIAKGYGGGGHEHAAGFKMPIGWEGEQ